MAGDRGGLVTYKHLPLGGILLLRSNPSEGQLQNWGAAPPWVGGVLMKMADYPGPAHLADLQR